MAFFFLYKFSKFSGHAVMAIATTQFHLTKLMLYAGSDPACGE